MKRISHGQLLSNCSTCEDWRGISASKIFSRILLSTSVWLRNWRKIEITSSIKSSVAVVFVNAASQLRVLINWLIVAFPFPLPTSSSSSFVLIPIIESAASLMCNNWCLFMFPLIITSILIVSMGEETVKRWNEITKSHENRVRTCGASLRTASMSFHFSLETLPAFYWFKLPKIGWFPLPYCAMWIDHRKNRV